MVAGSCLHYDNSDGTFQRIFLNKHDTVTIYDDGRVRCPGDKCETNYTWEPESFLEVSGDNGSTGGLVKDATLSSDVAMECGADEGGVVLRRTSVNAVLINEFTSDRWLSVLPKFTSVNGDDSCLDSANGDGTFGTIKIQEYDSVTLYNDGSVLC